MLRTTFFALAAMGLAATSQAAVIISWVGTPTEGKAGFTTYAVTAASDGAPIAGFDFFGTEADPLGFYGPMSQVELFGGAVSTVFADNNPVIDAQAGLNRAHDSQFSVNTTTVLVPAGFASESPTSLRAAFALTTPVQSLQFAQITLADGTAAEAVATFSGLVQLDPSVTPDPIRVSGIIPIPEPSTFALAGLALLGLIGYVRRS